MYKRQKFIEIIKAKKETERARNEIKRIVIDKRVNYDFVYICKHCLILKV